MNYQKFENRRELTKFIAKELFDNKVVAIFRGRSEMGPRALCNRSILANPCWDKAKDYLNKEIKFREYWRPYAPVMAQGIHPDIDKSNGSDLSQYEPSLIENYFEWFHATPYMTISPKLRDNFRDKLPGITHLDNTARVQTVRQHENEFIYLLLFDFKKLSGHAVLLNTSFNIDNQPIVESPKDAIETFKKSKIDYLVLNEKYLVRKNDE